MAVFLCVLFAKEGSFPLIGLEWFRVYRHFWGAEAHKALLVEVWLSAIRTAPRMQVSSASISCTFAITVLGEKYQRVTEKLAFKEAICFSWYLQRVWRAMHAPHLWLPATALSRVRMRSTTPSWSTGVSTIVLHMRQILHVMNVRFLFRWVCTGTNGGSLRIPAIPGDRGGGGRTEVRNVIRCIRRWIHRIWYREE